MSSSWITEGVSERSSPINQYPVRHLLVQGSGRWPDWRMWCSYGKGREATVRTNNNKKFCRECLALAQEAADEGTFGRDDAADQWPVNWPEGDE